MGEALPLRSAIPRNKGVKQTWLVTKLTPTSVAFIELIVERVNRRFKAHKWRFVNASETKQDGWRGYMARDSRIIELQQKLEQLHELDKRWGGLRREALRLAEHLQSRAAEEKRRADQFEHDGRTAEASEARVRERELLEEAEEVMRNAEDALNKQAEIEIEEDAGEAGMPHAADNRRPPDAH